jgi:hypothetical protein
MKGTAPSVFTKVVLLFFSSNYSLIANLSKLGRSVELLFSVLVFHEGIVLKKTSDLWFFVNHFRLA